MWGNSDLAIMGHFDEVEPRICSMCGEDIPASRFWSDVCSPFCGRVKLKMERDENEDNR